MPINFAFALHWLIQRPDEQNIILNTLRRAKKLKSDETRGAVAAAARDGIDRRPGAPSISEKHLLFALNRYFAPDVPGAELCACNQAEVIEVMLNQQFYQVICIEDFRGSDRPDLDWTPFMIRKVARARNFDSLSEQDAQKVRNGRNPPAPMNNPPMPLNQGINGPIVNDGNAYANAPANPYASAGPPPAGGPYVHPNDLIRLRRATT